MPHPKPKTGPAYKPVIKENQVVSISAIDSVKWMIDYGQYFHFYCTLGESWVKCKSYNLTQNTEFHVK